MRCCVDGLSSEREQKITIDVAYRFFSTEKRKFIVADTPGHEQYTRNMITGASTADLAVILIDARKGMLTQSRRHAYLASLLGIRRIVGRHQQDGSRRLFGECVRSRRRRTSATSPERIGVEDVTCIPISAVYGYNVARPVGHDALVHRAYASRASRERARRQ